MMTDPYFRCVVVVRLVNYTYADLVVCSSHYGLICMYHIFARTGYALGATSVCILVCDHFDVGHLSLNNSQMGLFSKQISMDL